MSETKHPGRERGDRRRPGWTAWLLLAMVGSMAVLALWAFWWEPGRLVVHEHELDLPALTDAPPLRAAVVADLHVGSPRNGIGNLRRVVSRVNELEPDIVLIAGDLVIDNVFGGSFVPPEEIAAELAALDAPRGTFAVLGNHDRWLSASRVTEALQSHGIEVLENRATFVDLGATGLWVAGASDYWTGHPDLFVEVPDRVALTIAGHTHGGQVILPFVGRAITPSRFGERYAAGHVEEEGRHLFVTTGIGTSRLGVRFLVPPEIALLRLGL